MEDRNIDDNVQHRRRRLLGLADVCMRVLVLYFIDFLLNGTIFGLCNIVFQDELIDIPLNDSIVVNNSLFNDILVNDLEINRQTIDFIDVLFSKHREAFTHFPQQWFTYCVAILFYMFSLIFSIFIFMAPTHMLWNFYRWLYIQLTLAAAIIYLIFCCKSRMVLHLFIFKKTILSGQFLNKDIYAIFGSFIVLHSFKALYSKSRYDVVHYLPAAVVNTPFYLPLLFLVLGFPANYALKFLFLVFTPLVLIEIYILLKSFSEIKQSVLLYIVVRRSVIRNFGLRVFLGEEWSRLNVPIILRVLWLSRSIFYIVYVVYASLPTTAATLLNESQPSDASNANIIVSFKQAIEYLLARSCETFVALLGMTTLLSSIGHVVGAVCHFMLNSAMLDDDEQRNIGSVCGVLFMVLAVQAGLTGLPVEKRLTRLYRNFCLLGTAILHFLHDSTNTVLMKLCTAGRFKPLQHLRVWFVSVWLLILPTVFVYYIWLHKLVLNPWLLSATLFAVEVIVKMLVSIAVYSLFMLGTRYPARWPDVDDYVYCVRAFGAVVEFLFGIVLFLNGIWILLFDYGGCIRAVMICLHAYANIWLHAKEGWENFRRRRLASRRIDALESPSEERLLQLDDVCSICYNQMTSPTDTKITRCGHYFHVFCLRKWLYVQDKCPMCHSLIHQDKPNSAASD